MPKVKTHSGAKKRFRRTKNGKLKRSSAYRRHHAWAKTSAIQKLHLRKIKYVSRSDIDNMRKLLPYS